MNHNKKRNVGIIYELLVRAISAYLVEGDKAKAQKALNILTNHYNRNTELFKEFRLFNALSKTTIKEAAIVATILSESRAAVKRFDQRKLDKEKSILIKEINHALVDDMFYRRNVPNYRIYATIQTLLNEWSLGDKSNLAETVVIESRLAEWLTSDKLEEVQQTDSVNHDVDALVVKIMNEKFNQKYDDRLTQSQKELINEYVFSLENDGGTSIKCKALEIKRNAINQINEIQSSEQNQILQEKIQIVKNKIMQLDIAESIDDEKLSKLMTLTQLIQEAREA